MCVFVGWRCRRRKRWRLTTHIHTHVHITHVKALVSVLNKCSIVVPMVFMCVTWKKTSLLLQCQLLFDHVRQVFGCCVLKAGAYNCVELGMLFFLQKPCFVVWFCRVAIVSLLPLFTRSIIISSTWSHLQTKCSPRHTVFSLTSSPYVICIYPLIYTWIQSPQLLASIAALCSLPFYIKQERIVHICHGSPHSTFWLVITYTIHWLSDKQAW